MIEHTKLFYLDKVKQARILKKRIKNIDMDKLFMM